MMRYLDGISVHAEGKARDTVIEALGDVLRLPAPALAQDALQDGAPAADSSDIIVTARRTEERLQDVPISISAFGEEQLRQRQLSTEADLQTAVPGLTIRQNGSANQFNYALRGAER